MHNSPNNTPRRRPAEDLGPLTIAVAITLLKAEMERGMRLMGAQSVGDLTRDQLRWR